MPSARRPSTLPGHVRSTLGCSIKRLPAHRWLAPAPARSHGKRQGCGNELQVARMCSWTRVRAHRSAEGERSRSFVTAVRAGKRHEPVCAGPRRGGAGLKSYSGENGLPGCMGATTSSCRHVDEHGKLAIGPAPRRSPGDKVMLIPGIATRPSTARLVCRRPGRRVGGAVADRRTRREPLTLRRCAAHSVTMKLTLARRALFWWRASVRASAATRLSITQRRCRCGQGARGHAWRQADQPSSYRASLTTLASKSRSRRADVSTAERITTLCAASRAQRPGPDGVDRHVRAMLPSPRWPTSRRTTAAQVELVVDSAQPSGEAPAGEIDVAVLTPSNLPPLLPSATPDRHAACLVGTPRRLGKSSRDARARQLPIISHAPPSLLFDSIRSWFAARGDTVRFNTCTSFSSSGVTAQGIGISLLPIEIVALKCARERCAREVRPSFVRIRVRVLSTRYAATKSRAFSSSGAGEHGTGETHHPSVARVRKIIELSCAAVIPIITFLLTEP